MKDKESFNGLICAGLVCLIVVAVFFIKSIFTGDYSLIVEFVEFLPDISTILILFYILLGLLPFCIGIFISHKFGKLCEELGGKYWIGFLGGPISTIYYIGKKLAR